MVITAVASILASVDWVLGRADKELTRGLGSRLWVHKRTWEKKGEARRLNQERFWYSRMRENDRRVNDEDRITRRCRELQTDRVKQGKKPQGNETPLRLSD